MQIDTRIESQVLVDDLLSIYDRKVKWGPIGESVFNRTYPRVKVDGSKESYHELAIRVVDGNLGLVDTKYTEPGERTKLLELLLDFGILPAGRHLSASGVKGRQFLFNCHAAGWDPKDPVAHYSFTFDQLMQGGGVGSNYSNRYLSTMPTVKKKVNLKIVCRDDHPNIGEFANLVSKDTKDADLFYVVPDTREGWVESQELVIKAAYNYTDYKNVSNIVIDVSEIRARGEQLKTSGGIACGPEPLVSMLIQFTDELNKYVGHRLGSLAAMKLDHITAACVVAGGKRRSSRMSVKSWKDMDIFHFISSKDVEGEMWTTNISVETDNDFEAAYKAGNERAREIMRKVVEGKRKNGEPGLWNISLASSGEKDPSKMFCPNPCGEIGLYMWENCNLGHINLQYFANKPLKQCLEAFRLMTRWLIRATFGDIPQDRQQVVTDENRRIGVGFLGFHGWLALNGIKYSNAWKDDFVIGRLGMFREVVDKEAVKFSKELGIPTPVKTTALAPTGTVSLLPGVVSSAQALIAKWFKRRVRYFNSDPELNIKIDQGYTHYPDPDAKNTEIVEFICEDPLVAQVRNSGYDPDILIECQDEVGFEDSLEVQAMIQDVYANNAVSYTINFPEAKLAHISVDDMMDAIMRRHNRLKGTTLFVDKSRKNSPFERITKEQFDAFTGPKEIVQIEEECRTGCPSK